MVIPSSLTAQPLAVWLTENKPPAVIINGQTIFVGGRWGVSGVTPAAFDVNWLKTVLNRYGINETNQLVAENSIDIPPCNIVDFNAPRQSSPILPPVYLPHPEQPLIEIDLTPESNAANLREKPHQF